MASFLGELWFKAVWAKLSAVPVHFAYNRLTSSLRKCKDSWPFPLSWFLQLINKMTLYQGTILEDHFSSCRSHSGIQPLTPHLSSQSNTHNLLQEMIQLKKKTSPLIKNPKHQNTTTTSPIYEITGLRNLSVMQLPLQIKRLCQGTQKGNEM